jgi:hypothetical protein
VIAYKFLREGRVAPFSGVPWPEPGEWLEAETVELCRSGVHACRASALPYWLRPELWEVELDGDLLEGELTVVAPRGRLVRRIEAWNRDTERAFGDSCGVEARRRVSRSPELEPYADDAEQSAGSAPVVAGFIVARLAELQDGPAGYDAERARQARWLAETLGLA